METSEIPRHVRLPSVRIPWGGVVEKWTLNFIQNLRAAGLGVNRFRVRANMKKGVAARSQPAGTVVRMFPGKRHAKSSSHAEENEHNKLRSKSPSAAERRSVSKRKKAA